MSGTVAGPPVIHPGPRMGGPRFSSYNADSSGASHSFHHRPRLGYQAYRLYPRPVAAGQTSSEQSNQEYDGRRLRKSLVRKTVDYNAAIIKALQNRVWQRDHRDRRTLEPDYSYAPDTVPPSLLLDNPVNAVTSRYVKSATNKMRCPIFCMAWTPEGRRLVTGASSGEFTLWNGLTFNFETILQAHDSSVRSMVWSHNDIWMVTADHAGYVKYWQSNMNNVKMFQAHKEAVRGLSFSPTDTKFASCSDDGTVRIWDFYTCYEEKILRGHGADVKCVDWHPHKGILVSGSKDNQQPIKIWDPKAGQPLATIHAHKSTVMDLRWNRNGNWLLTASRDHLVKVFDIRKLSQELQVFRGHKKEASCVAWHPIHEDLFASGGSDGSILFWTVGCEKEVGAIENAHDNIIWTLAWHPVGHILCSGSNDHTSKFWTRQKPGDIIRDKGHGAFHDYSTLDDNDMEEAFIPGMGPDDKIETAEEEKEDTVKMMIPGLDLTEQETVSVDKPQVKKTPYQKPIPKKFQAIWNDTKVELDDLEDDRGRTLLERSTPARSPSPPSQVASSSNDMGIFNPNVGFGPMGAQFNNPFGGQQQLHPGGNPFVNPSPNPFMQMPMSGGSGPSGGRGGGERSDRGNREGRDKRDGGRRDRESRKRTGAGGGREGGSSRRQGSSAGGGSWGR